MVLNSENAVKEELKQQAASWNIKASWNCSNLRVSSALTSTCLRRFALTKLDYTVASVEVKASMTLGLFHHGLF